jgi:hypothetical protein
MGYTTNFSGYFEVTPDMKPEHHEYINKFRETRRMKRDSQKALLFPDPIRETAGLCIGLEGSYFVGGVGYYGQDRDDSVIESNEPPEGQPGLWCQWIVNDVGNVEWDESEKFYNYVEWLQYLIDHFFSKWEYTLNGTVYWQGEDLNDIGRIFVKDNIIEVTNFSWENIPTGFPFFQEEEDEDW